MKLAQAVVSFLLLCMTAALIYAFARGDFFAEGAQLLAMPWGVVSLVDVYIGFLLFAGWILYREASPLNKTLWVAALIVLGNWIACIYVLLALRSSGGDARRFWLGGK